MQEMGGVTSGKRKNSGREPCERFAREDVRKWTSSTWAQVTGHVAEHGLKWLGYLDFYLIRVEPCYMAKIFVNIFWVVFLGAWGWEAESGLMSTILSNKIHNVRCETPPCVSVHFSRAPQNCSVFAVIARRGVEQMLRHWAAVQLLRWESGLHYRLMYDTTQPA